MTIKTSITDTRYGREVKVGLDNRLYTGPSSFSSAYSGELGTDNAVVNVVEAQANKIFVITDLILTGNKNISTSIDATVEIYEAGSATSATVDNYILNIPLERSGRLVMNGLFLATGESKYINARTSDDDVFVTIFGYYVTNGGTD